MDPTLILVTPSKHPKTLHRCYSKDIPSYFLATGKCLLFVFCSLRYLTSLYYAISRQEVLGKEKKTYEFIIPEKNTSGFSLEMIQFCHGINVLTDGLC